MNEDENPFTLRIEDALTRLSRSRPVFHSEADFQHALAWELHRQRPNCSVRLEFRPLHATDRIYVDIWMVDEGRAGVIELKYKTRSLKFVHDGEEFDLSNQGAQDLGRYDFLKDVQRLEGITSKRNDIAGLALFLTNDSSYWNPSRSGKTVDSSFRIDQNRIIGGSLSWGGEASKGTILGREETIMLKGRYNAQWRDYSTPTPGEYGKFCYLALKVNEAE